MSLLKWALIMFVVSLVAALFGFTGLAAASADVARILFYIFLVIFLVLLVLGPRGGESRAWTLTSGARCQVRQRPAAAKREPRPSVAVEKRACSSVVSGILRGAGGTRTPLGETPNARQIFRIRARYAWFISGTSWFARLITVLAQSFYRGLRRIFRAPSQSLSGWRSPSLASSIMNFARITASGS
jgi:uncharacterized membrane protein YtjA (UPF0391 family)